MVLAGLVAAGASGCRRAEPAKPQTQPPPIPLGSRQTSPPPATAKRVHQGGATLSSGLRTINGVRVLTLVGTPEEMGRRHGELLGEEVRWVVSAVIHRSVAPEAERRREFIERVKVMEKFLAESWKRELRTLASAAAVDYWELVALQLFGDVERAQLCSSFAVFGRATLGGECIVGRNFDYWYEDVARRSSVIIDYHPAGTHRFVTLSWAGVINGWTLMNDHGIVGANNTSYSGGVNSLQGLSTCFMLRKIAEQATSVAEGIELVQKTPRACSTNLLIAGGDPPAAAIVEYDHERLVVRHANDDYVLATNSFVRLGQEDAAEPEYGRYGVLRGLIRANYGKIDRGMNFAGAEGVPIESINLHSTLLFPKDLTFRAAMGQVPACRGSYPWFRVTPAGVVSAEPGSAGTTAK
jgi:hypothetical protein